MEGNTVQPIEKNTSVETEGTKKTTELKTAPKEKPKSKPRKPLSKREQLQQKMAEIQAAMEEHEAKQLERVTQLAKKHNLDQLMDSDPKLLDEAFAKIAAAHL